MKRTFLIIGLIIILILAGILLFLLFASDNQKKELFNQFNIGNTDSGESILDTVVDTLTGGDESASFDTLRQLTTKQVIGHTEIDAAASSTNSLVYFAEAGTGHIYSIDVMNGVETRLSNITIQTAHEAHIDRTGSYAVVAADAGREGKELTLITLPTSGAELASFVISEPARDFTLTNDGAVLFSTLTGGTLVVRAFDINKKETTTLFTLPFSEATVLFGNTRSDDVHVYPKTAERLEGYVYKVSGGKLERLPVSGYGLTASVSNDNILYTTFSDGVYASYVYSPSLGATVYLENAFISDKCTTLDMALLCGGRSTYNSNSIEAWYKGIPSGTDDLWLIDTTTYQEAVLISPKESELRDFDITNITASRDLSRIYFTNKLDNSLWIFERPVTPVQ